jgi:hypothetical protein
LDYQKAWEELRSQIHEKKEYYNINGIDEYFDGKHTAMLTVLDMMHNIEVDASTSQGALPTGANPQRIINGG